MNCGSNPFPVNLIIIKPISNNILSLFLMNFPVELTVGYLPWKSMQDKDEVCRCKQLCRKDEYIKELFGGCPREYIAIMRLIDSIRFTLLNP